MWHSVTPFWKRVGLMLLVCLQPLFLSMPYMVSRSETGQTAAPQKPSDKMMAVVEYYSGEKLDIEYYHGSVCIYHRPEHASGLENYIRIRVPETDTVCKIPLQDIDRFDVTFPREKDCDIDYGNCMIKCCPRIAITGRNNDRIEGILDTAYVVGKMDDFFPYLLYHFGFVLTVTTDDSVYQLDQTSKSSCWSAKKSSSMAFDPKGNCLSRLAQLHQSLRRYAPSIRSCVFEWSKDYPAALEKYRKEAGK